MSKLAEIIDEIRSKPDMYIGRSSIFCLRAYLFGCYRIFSQEDLDLLNNFQLFIEKKYEISTSHSWADILHFYSSDEKDALILFFKEFDDFTKLYSSPASASVVARAGKSRK